MSERRTGFLLGAGASKDAGLPLTDELAARLIEGANVPAVGRGLDELDREEWVIALNFVYGAMVGHQAEGGRNPLAVVNVERLISALRLLQNLRAHEAAPFVMSWKTLANSLGRRTISAPHGRLASILENSRRVGASRLPLDEIETAIAEIAETVVQAQVDSGPVFRKAEEHVLRDLSRILSGIESVDYLLPIMELAARQEGGVDVVSLNYDLAVEAAALRTESISVETGIDKWVPGLTVPFELANNQVNLIKIHGSLNWRRLPSNSLVGGVEIHEMQMDGAPEQDGSGWQYQRNLPWIVVGDREKLATDGPTLDLLVAAREALNRTDNLVVVGYGFADDHVNNLLRDWMARRATNTMTIVSPDLVAGGYDANEFRRELRQLYEATVGNGMVSRVGVVSEGAATGLPRAIRYEYPTPQEPIDYLSVEIGQSGDQCMMLRITCNGPAPSRLLVSASVTRLDGAIRSWNSSLPVLESLPEVSAIEQASAGQSTSVELRDLQRGDERTLYLPLGSYEQMTIHIRVERSDSLGFAIEETYEWNESVWTSPIRRIIPTSRAYPTRPRWRL